jgi:hypothetical protein
MWPAAWVVRAVYARRGARRSYRSRSLFWCTDSQLALILSTEVVILGRTDVCPAVRAQGAPPDPRHLGTAATGVDARPAQAVSVVVGVLTKDGALVHLRATTHQGIESHVTLPWPRPPRQEIDRLIKGFLGPQRRAGKGRLRDVTPGDAEIASYEAEIYRAAGFTDPTRVEVPGRVVARIADDIVASVFSLSGSAPHLFGDRRQSFEAELRELLKAVSPHGRFSEQMRESAIDIWRA